MMLHLFCKKRNGVVLDQEPNTNQENIPPKLDPIRKPPRVYKMPTMSGRRKWTYEAFKEVMDAIENINVTLRKASRLWNLPLNSLFNILNGKTRTRKVGVKGVLIAREDVGMLTWILTMNKVGLSINIQQLKQKVAKIT